MPNRNLLSHYNTKKTRVLVEHFQVAPAPPHGRSVHQVGAARQSAVRAQEPPGPVDADENDTPQLTGGCCWEQLGPKPWNVVGEF